MARKILIIDDEKALAEVISIRLETFGYKMIIACSGGEGLRLAAEERPDLIILDIMMPKMDGYETLEHLKKNTKTSNIPVVMLSALTDPDDIAKLTELTEVGVVDYIFKPFQPENLHEKIEKALT